MNKTPMIGNSFRRIVLSEKAFLFGYFIAIIFLGSGFLSLPVSWAGETPLPTWMRFSPRFPPSA